MIHRLEIENFYSICETQVIDLRVGAKVPDGNERFAEINDGSGDRVPKTVALYGANASGKSTVLKALSVLRWFLVYSIESTTGGIVPFQSFADDEHDARPTRIRVDFDWVGDLTQIATVRAHVPFVRYMYEVRFGGQVGRPEKFVLSEELRVLPPQGKSRKVFERNAAGEVSAGPIFPLKGLNHVLSKLRSDVSLTSTIAQFAEHAPTRSLIAWARRVMSNILWEKFEMGDADLVDYYARRPEMVVKLNEIVRKVDLGVGSVSLTSLLAGPALTFSHSGLGRPLALLSESHGTRQFIKIFPQIKEALMTGGLAVLDELDSTIHPMLVPEILRWFHDPVENPHHAQLWFSGHSASLLEDLQKEEIFFTEKDSHGRTSIYGLKEIESVRRSDNFYQKYLGGVYGAVPRIG